ncbi:g4541 [Coccomyxa viridis]|uniref:G4541 protein n=1 Tax=Coccomyxa viridis TaxID=1274662 RepID=A0ABP1FUI5_9CHLO
MGLFGRETRAAPAPSSPPPHREGCCASVSRALCSGIISTILFCIFGLSICALVGRRYYWCFYTTHFGDPGAYWISGGWLDFADRDLGTHSLKDANFGLWIIGIISAAALLASAFIAFMEFFVSITGNAGRHTAGLSFPMGIILVGILICYIAAAAIELEKWSGNNLGTRYRVWPSWGWICAIVAGVLWWFVGSFAACLGPKYGKAKRMQTTAGGYPAEHHYPTTPAAGAAGAGAGAGTAAAGKPKRGLFGRNKNAAGPGTPQNQHYAAQPFNANADRDVEMGNTGVPHNGQHGHMGEGLAAGAGAGAGAAAAARHHDNKPRAQTNTDAVPPQQEKRGLFGRKKVTTPNATSADTQSTDQPTYANQPRTAQGQGAFPDAAQTGTGPRTGANQGGGAWAGSPLTAEQEAQRGNKGSAWAGENQVPSGAGTGVGTGVGTGTGTGGAVPTAQAGRKKSGFLSFYH